MSLSRFDDYFSLSPLLCVLILERWVLKRLLVVFKKKSIRSSKKSFSVEFYNYRHDALYIFQNQDWTAKRYDDK